MPPSSTSRLTVAVGPTDPAAGATVLHLGPHHPSGHGGLRLALTVEDGTVATAEPLVGQLHRGAEKLFEVRDYRQIALLASRHDWLSGFANELGACLVAETMLGLEVPPRATWLRTLLCELTRVASHLAFLGPALAGPAAERPHPAAQAGRELTLGLLDLASGARMHLALARVGGLDHDVPDGWTQAVRRALAPLAGAVAELDAALGSAEVRDRLRGVGRVSAEQVHDFGLSGPLARASGVDADLRRDEPYLSYPELAPVRVAVRTAGDALARLECLVEQCAVSLELVEACLRRLPTGPVAVRTPTVLRVPAGSCYGWSENPLGLMGYYLVSRGGPQPWRLHLRTPSFAAVQALRSCLPGTPVAAVGSVLATMLFVVGDVDK